MKKKFRQYCGFLTTSEIAKGMNAANENARRLADDAKLLFQHESYPSAVAMAILSIEESGKVSILRELALARNQEEAAQCWRDYRSHVKKNVLWPIADSYLKGARRAQDFLSLLDPEADHPYVLDKIKQISFYTDCFQKGHWAVPKKLIGKEFAHGLLRIADSFARSREITVEEVDLWVKYLSPYWKTSTSSMQKALFEWDKEIRKRGLVDKTNALTMETFFTKGIDLEDENPS
jgi:AbiV family abortive infection protein